MKPRRPARLPYKRISLIYPLAALITLSSPAAPQQGRATDSQQFSVVLKTISNAIASEYYDPSAGDTWTKIEAAYRDKIKIATTKPEQLHLVRKMLSELHNSHIFFYTREEWAMRQKVLPFFFENIGQRTFVRKPFNKSPFEFGDEIISIDGKSASILRQRNLARLDDVDDNPLYGPATSSAKLTVLRGGKELDLQVTRSSPKDEEMEMRSLQPGIVYLAFTDLSNESAAQQSLQNSWKQAMSAKAIILDLRDCGGGWPSTIEYLLDSLLGARHRQFVIQNREKHTIPSEPAFAAAPKFTGTVVVLQGGQTQSGGELLAATLKEAGRATLVGERTAGAFNGFTKTVELPGNFALFALPYTKSVSPAGIEYERMGVQPDVLIQPSIADFQAHRDTVLQRSLQIASSGNRSVTAPTM